MTAPAPAPAGWLLIADVKEQLKMRVSDTSDDVLIQDCIDAAEPEITRARPDAWSDTLTPADYPDAYRAGVLLAARLVRRRNSPAGVESFGDSVSWSASGDPELDRFMRTGNSRLPAVG